MNEKGAALQAVQTTAINALLMLQLHSLCKDPTTGLKHFKFLSRDRSTWISAVSSAFTIYLFAKLECLAALCRTLFHPQLMRKIFGEEKFWVKNFLKKNPFFLNESCLKLPQLPRNHVSRGSCHRQRDWPEGPTDYIVVWQAESLPESSKARQKSDTTVLRLFPA